MLRKTDSNSTMEDSRQVGVSDIFRDIYSRANAANPDILKLMAVLDATKDAVAAAVSAGDGKKKASKATAENAAALESPLAYFGALMTALERTGVTHAKEIFYLLSLLLPHLPAAVVKAKYDAIAAMCGAAMKSPALHKDQPTVRSVVVCMGHVLKAIGVDAETWARPDVPRLLSGLLTYSTDPRPKVRRAAQSSCFEIAIIHHGARSEAAAPVYTTFFATILAGSSQKEQMTILQAMPLLRQTMPLLPQSQIMTVADRVLKLVTIGNAKITVQAFASLATLLESPRARLTIKFVQQLVAALVGMVPSPDDHAPAAEYSYLLAAAMTRLANMERIKCGASPDVPMSYPRGGIAAQPSDQSGTLESVTKHLPSAVRAMMSNLQSDRIAVHHATTNALSIMLVTCIDGPMVKEARTWVVAHPSAVPTSASSTSAPEPPAGAPCLVQLVSVLDSMLQYKYQSAWPVALPLLAVVYRLLGPDAFPLLNKITLSIVSIRESVAQAADDAAAARAAEEDDDDDEDMNGRRRRKGRGDDSDDEDGNRGRYGGAADGSGAKAPATKIFSAMEAVLAAAVRAMGAHHFVQIVGLAAQSAAGTKGAPSSLVVREDRTWVLPLLRDNAQYCETPLAFFMSTIVPIFRGEEAAAVAAENTHHPKQARMHRARVMQLWNLLPVLGVAPPDFGTAFNVPMGKLLTQSMTDPKYPDLPTVIGRALETMIVRNRAAAGLPIVSIERPGADADNDEDENDDEGMDDGGSVGDVDAGLTVAGGGKAAGGKKKQKQNQKGKKDDDDEDGDDSDEDDDDDSDDEGAAGARGAGRSVGDGEMSVDGGATTVFGAGGVSVYAGGEGNDPRHALLVQALGSKDKLPTIEKAVAEANLNVLAGFSKNYVPILFNAYEVTTTGSSGPASSAAAPATASSAAVANDRSRKVLDAIVSYISISPADLVAGMCDRLHKLIVASLGALAAAQSNVEACKATHKAAEAANSKGQAGPPTRATGAALAASKEVVASASAKACSLLSLATAMIPSLPAIEGPVDDSSMIFKLYKAIKQAVTSDDSQYVQKRAYNVLASILAHHPGFIAGNDTKRSEVLALLSDSLMTVSASARRGRLTCLRYMVKALDLNNQQQAQLVPLMLGEVMLCCKDSNGKVRMEAFHLLMAMARKMAAGGDGDGLGGMEEEVDEDEDAASSAADAAPVKANLSEFFKMVLAGIAASTPHMRSATLLALSRLIYEFSDRAVVHSMLEPILDTALLLLKEKAREVVTSVVSFIKVIISCMPPAELTPLLPRIVKALMVWSGERKERIKMKIRTVLERLVRKLGYDTIAPLVPSNDEALMRHMKKMADRRAKKKATAIGVAAELEAGAAGAGSAVDETKTSVSRRSGAKTAFDELADFGDDDDDADDDDIFGSSASKSGASVASSRWPGTIPRPAAAMTKIGGAGSRMSAVTAQMRESSRILTAAAPSLPAVGSIVDPSVMGRKYQQKEGSVVSKMLGRDGDAKTAKTAKSGKTSVAASGANGRVPQQMLRSDDASPLDLLDPSAMRSVVGQDPHTLAALDRRRKAAEAASASGNAGFMVAHDGRLIISDRGGDSDAGSGGDDSDDEDADMARVAKKARGRAAGSSSAAAGDDDMDMGGADGNDDDDSDDGGRGRSGGAKGRSVMDGKKKDKYKQREKDSGAAPAAGGAGSGWGQKKTKHGQQSGRGGPNGSGDRYSGAQYQSKGKTGRGDVKNTGSKYEPFAYVPLGKTKNSALVTGGSKFSSVMASTSKAVRSSMKRGIVAEAEISSSGAGKKRGRE